jgi:hypothetical protein
MGKNQIFKRKKIIEYLYKKKLEKKKQTNLKTLKTNQYSNFDKINIKTFKNIHIKKL